MNDWPTNLVLMYKEQKRLSHLLGVLICTDWNKDEAAFQEYLDTAKRQELLDQWIESTLRVRYERVGYFDDYMIQAQRYGRYGDL